jgi:hypothetical protein
LFVLKLVFGTADNADSITVWRNPTSLGGSDPSGSQSLSTFNLQFDRFTFAQFNADGNNEVAFDEIRFGTTFADVTPVPEPINVSLAIFALAVAGVAGARRAILGYKVKCS